MDDVLKEDIQDEVVDEVVDQVVDEVVDEVVDDIVDEVVDDEEYPDDQPDDQPEEQPVDVESERYNVILSRLDALEERIGELMIQGGVDNSVLEDDDDDELSDIELENQKWYARNAIRHNY